MPINRVPKRIRGVVFGTPFGGICDWYLTFSCPKHSPGAALDRPDPVSFFVCLSDVCNTVFRDPFWTKSMDVQLTFQKRDAQKRGPTRHAPPRWTVFGATLPRSLHSPQVATAASPSPVSVIGGAAVVNVHLWCHLPPRVQF